MIPTPNQPIGPFFHFALTPDTSRGRMAGPDSQGERIRLVCRVFDRDAAPVTNAMVELWQADGCGRYNDPGFGGFGRLATDEHGSCVFETVKPGRVPGLNGEFQAPHICVSVYAPGLLRRVVTRIYFAGDPANDLDEVLELVPADRRVRLMAVSDAGRIGAWTFDLRLQGAGETVFFDI